MDKEDAARIATLLEQIRNNQAEQLAIVALLILYLSWLIFR